MKKIFFLFAITLLIHSCAKSPKSVLPKETWRYTYSQMYAGSPDYDTGIITFNKNGSGNMTPDSASSELFYWTYKKAGKKLSLGFESGGFTTVEVTESTTDSEKWHAEEVIGGSLYTADWVLTKQ